VDAPGRRALALSGAGLLDGAVRGIADRARDDSSLAQDSPPIYYIEPAMFTMTLRFEVRGWQSIKNCSIGIVRGGGSSEAGTLGMSRGRGRGRSRELIRMLDAGCSDPLVTDLFSGRVAVMRMSPEACIHPLSPPIERLQIYHHRHERHRDLAERVAAVIRGLDATGELAALRERLVREVLDAP
jgi:hypothetical protein